MSEKGPKKGRFLAPDRLVKERTREKKEAMVATLSFYNGCFGDSFLAEQNTVDGRGLFGGNLSKNRESSVCKRFAKFVEVNELGQGGSGRRVTLPPETSFLHINWTLELLDSRTNKCLFWIWPSLPAHLKPCSIDNRVLVKSLWVSGKIHLVVYYQSRAKKSKADFTVGNLLTNISEGTAYLLQGLTYNETLQFENQRIACNMILC